MRDIELSVRGIGYTLTQFTGSDEEAKIKGCNLYYDDDEGGEEVSPDEVEIMWSSEEY